MTRKIVLPILTVFFVALLTSFIAVDFNKMLVGKWELKTIQKPGQPAMETKPVLGDSFIKFNSDFTYEESGGRETTGIWKITDDKYLQTKTAKQANFTEKVELKELAPDKIEMKLSDKTKMVYQLVK